MEVLKKILFVFLLLPLVVNSREIELKESIKWNSNVQTNINESFQLFHLSFNNAKYNSEKEYLPYFSKQLSLNQDEITNVVLVNVVYEPIPSSEIVGVSGLNYVSNSLVVEFDTYISRKKNFGEIRFHPIIKDGSSYKRVVSFDLNVSTKRSSLSKRVNNKAFGTSSVLSTGDWYKVSVSDDGVYKLTYDFLKDLGFDIDNLNPNDFKLYGNGGKMLPALNSDIRADDLQQNAITVIGAGDNKFDPEDYVLFYGQSPHSWNYDATTNLFKHQNHQFSDNTYYFLTFSSTGETPKRISTQSNHPSPNNTVTSFSDYDFHERDAINLIKSGSSWYGDVFDAVTSYNYAFNFPGLDLSTPVSVYFSGAGRAGTNSSFTASIGSTSSTLLMNFVSMTNTHGKHAWPSSQLFTALASSSVINLGISYSKPSTDSKAWLDEIEINVRRNLALSGDQLFFRDLQSIGAGAVSTFTLGNAISVEKVWEITDPFNVKEQSVVVTGNNLAFSLATDSLREFVALTNQYQTNVVAEGRVDNQDLHGISSTDMIIVSHPDFLSHSAQISTFHTNEGLDVITVTPQQIYNEFSSGSQDIVAIRDFVRMLYEKAPTAADIPKYLLLVGDGSYDNKNRVVGNSNFIPTYQTPNSVDIIGSLVSDDYYGLLDPNEGTWNTTEYMDIAIGRLPVKNTEEASNVVNKLLNYNTPSTMKDWRNRVSFVGDDEDGNLHMDQSNFLSGIVENGYKEYNIDKTFFDAYQQESTPGGSRYPGVKKSINNAVNEGALIVNYTGHGGETGWGHERVLEISDINSWTNTNYPLFITATCEFSRFDDPSRTSAGELVLLSPNGGLGLLTTVRLVFAFPNFILNQTFFNEVFKEVNNEMQTIGDVFLTVKNLNAGDSNNRNFTLLGDPAIKLAYPIHDVVTTQINGAAVSSSDTLRALQKVTVTGEVRDKAGLKMGNYNGIIYPTVLDKAKDIVSLSNDGGSPFSFDIQTSKLFKGKASVVNGDFSYTFYVPRDIAYNYGQGKLSHYAENQVEDGHGYHNDFYIGGTSDSITSDELGPDLELYMNDESFVFGGMTDENPTLLANIYDLHGINMVGNGIGHDITAILDNETENAFILNDYYEADLNSYQRGRVFFPFENLAEGRHTLTVKVWDVYNNSSEAVIEFVVVKSQDIVIDRVYNYPNPFTTYTEFWFEHNQPGKSIYAQVQVFTVSGKLVKTLEKNIYSAGFRSTSITWNGLDDYGDRIARGVYVYRLKVRADNYSVAEKYQKLVILR